MGSFTSRPDDPVRVATPGPTPPAQRNGQAQERLLDAIESLAGMVRRGDVADDLQQGVLLDEVIDNIRFLMLEQTPSLLVELSPREQQIALMVARGRTNQAIASALEISPWTVSTHLRRIFAKLAVSSRAEMVAHLLAQAEFASQAGQLPLE
ncbi:MAG: helix-turn-helix transcriptional regulator [Marmoricola sp.]|nr:helix-turn-helix transcriptional regulator [Marmoricola sp.]